MPNLPENIEYIDMVSPRRAFIIKKICERYSEEPIIEVGCGKGRITQLLGESGVHIVGIDIDAHEIEDARQANTLAHVEFRCASLSEIPDRAFAGILLTEVLEHIHDPADFLTDIHRICKQGGFLLMTIPNGNSVKERVLAVVRFLKKNPFAAVVIAQYKRFIKRREVFNDSPHVQRFTLPRIRMLLQQSGFTIQEEWYGDLWSGFLWMYMPWLPIPMSVRKIERNLTSHLPPYLLGDWGFLCVKTISSGDSAQMP